MIGLEVLIFRGGVGDFFLWLPHVNYYLSRWKPSHADLWICSPWPEAIYLWASFLPNRPRQIVPLPYARPAPLTVMGNARDNYGTIRVMDVWRGPEKRLAAPDGCFGPLPIHGFPDNYYPVLEIPGDGVGGTVVQSVGRSVGQVEIPPRLLADVPQPIRYLDGWTDPVAIYAAIRDAELLVGIDSGFRNIAFTCRVPVIEVATPGRGRPDYRVFVPRVYRDRWTLVDLEGNEIPQETIPWKAKP